MKNDRIYVHFKGGHYVKLYEALHTETNEELVVYKSMAEEDNTIYARPKEMFYEEVKTQHYTGPRFKLIDKEDI